MLPASTPVRMFPTGTAAFVLLPRIIKKWRVPCARLRKALHRVRRYGAWVGGGKSSSRERNRGRAASFERGDRESIICGESAGGKSRVPGARRLRIDLQCPRERRAESEMLDEWIEILVAVKQCKSFLDTAGRDQCVDGLSYRDAARP
jgi:hypothetical protein